MKEREFVDKFIEDLANKYGYSKQSVKRDVRIGNFIFDIAIQKGIVYVQAFEFKTKLSHEVRNVYQKFSDVSVETPFYCVVFDHNGEYKLYDGNNIEKEVKDISGVLNYNNAIAKFFRPTLMEFEAVKKSISRKCHTWAGVTIIYSALYILCEACPCINVNIPLTSEIITIGCLSVVLSLLPSILKLWNYIKQIKIGAFELELREELYK